FINIVHVSTFTKKMESQRSSGDTYNFHLCYLWKPYRSCRQKIDEFFTGRKRFAMGYPLHNNCHPALACLCFTGQYIFWTVSLFHQIPGENRKKNGRRKEK